MPSLIPGYAYDIFISYRQKDNRQDEWVTLFVNALQHELDATFKEDVSIYFDINPHDGLLETHDVGNSLKGKLKCLVFIPIISQTYCDPKCFAWEHEFLAFKKFASDDSYGLKVKLPGGNVANRILPVRIHELDSDDRLLLETELGGVLRSVDFIYKGVGVNRPLATRDDEVRSAGRILYRDQVNKVANSVKDIITGMRGEGRAVQSPRLRNRHTEAVRPSGFGTMGKKRMTWLAITVLMLFVVSLLLYLKFSRNLASGNSESQKSIVVLPFENLSDDKEQEYFCEGMMDEILNHLSKIADLRVTSRTSAMKFRERNLSGVEFAKALGVSHFLEGSVRKSGEKVRITIQLIDAATDQHVWSEDYDYRDLKDVFAVQTDVSTQVARILKIKLTEQPLSHQKNFMENIPAYKFYRKGRFFWDRRNPQSYDSAEVYYKRAIELDPAYALAYVGLADLYIFDVRTTSLARKDAIPIAKLYVEKAISLDSTLSEAWTTIGFIKSHFDFDWNGAKPILEKAIRLNPSYATAHVFYGNIFIFTGNDKLRGVQEVKKALQLDPLSASVNWILGRSYYDARLYDSAIAQFQKAVLIDPNNSYIRQYLSLCFVAKKNFKQAIEVANRLPETFYGSMEYRVLILSYIYAISGDKLKAKKELDNWLAAKNKSYSHFWLAHVYVALENYDKALSELEIEFDERGLWGIALEVDPMLDPIRNQPRFKDLLKKMNFN